jgi:hypothetical protein
MARYAEGTAVPVEKTRVEIEETLRRFGADAFSSGYEERRAFIAFRARGRFIRLTLALPDPGAKEFTQLPTGRPRAPGVARDQYEAECRRRWRSLGLLVKAKVAAVSDGISEFEAEFLANVVLPDGQTVAHHARPAIAAAYENGEVPRLLPPSAGGL